MGLKSVFYSCALLFFIVGSSFGHKSVPWTPIDWKTIPPAEADDKIEVFYLICPLLEEDFGDILEYVNLYHSAVAFQNNRTGNQITINYDADDFFRSSLFPVISEASNGTRELSWINQGGNFIYEGINSTYWTAGTYTVSVINGTLFNRFLSEFNNGINATYPYYNMLSILDKFGAKSWVPSWDCFDFVWASFNYLNENGAELDYTLHLKRDFVNLYGDMPIDYTDLFENDPVIREEIIDFFAFITLSYEELSFKEFLEAVVTVFDGEFYVRSSDAYWKTQIHFPYFAVDFDEQPLPGQV